MSLLRNTVDKLGKPGEDIGLDRSGQHGRQRTVNLDGTYNMDRITGKFLGNFHLYNWLITTSWKNYWMTIFCTYFFANLIFACIYYLIGPEKLHGIEEGPEFAKFMHCFFFSSQSFTTVGYGGIYPTGNIASSLAAFEAFVGITTFAIVTGALYGRFSRPKADIIFSPNALVAPFGNSHALMMLCANQSSNSLVEVEALINFSWTEKVNGVDTRLFKRLGLEIDKIAMFPTSWTIVHPVNEESPLQGWTNQDMLTKEVEIFILIKGFDEVFSQTVYYRHSFVGKEIVWGGKFKRPFFINEKGKTVLDLTVIGEFNKMEISEVL
jgi:inward rectifier potassium channel